MKQPLSETSVLNALRLVKDPDLHRDIVTLGFIKDMKIEKNNINFKLELTTPACPVRDELKAASEQAIRDHVENVGQVSIEMTASVRVSPTQQRAEVLTGVKNTIAVASGKGGVGKSTVAVNLAVSLALDGAKVGLLDADIYGPSIPLMMGINERPTMKGQKLLPLKAHGVGVMSIGFLVDPMQAVIWRGPMVSGAVKQFMSDVDWGELDYLIFDLPPGTGDIHLTLVQSIPLSGAVVVTTPQDISLADARKAFAMFQKVHVPILGIIENMSYYICGHCGHREEIFSNGGGKKAAADLKVPFIGDIPIYTPIRVGGDTGKPIVVLEPEAIQSKQIRQITRNMAAQLSIQSLSTPTPKIEIDLGVN
ncbi:MAG: iron-sulfur cluster carrier protein ApbC [Bacteroidetes bacterium]|nr:MAG: iron-sulfur cluster carrier protein ApbC [Bacteroidota bacterium]